MAKKQKSVSVEVTGEMGPEVTATAVAEPKKRKRAKAPEPAPVVDAVPAAPVADTTPSVEPAPAPKRKRTKATATHPDAPTGEHVPTLTDLAAGYLAHLEASGKSPGTVFSYRLELAVALDELGATTPVRELTAERIQGFFESERVTVTRSGRPKSPLSIDKTRRVLRQAIAWAADRGIVEASVVPDAAQLASR